MRQLSPSQPTGSLGDQISFYYFRPWRESVGALLWPKSIQLVFIVDLAVNNPSRRRLISKCRSFSEDLLEVLAGQQSERKILVLQMAQLRVVLLLLRHLFVLLSDRQRYLASQIVQLLVLRS